MHFNVYCIAPRQQNPLHRHPISDEILYFVEGRGECVVGRDTYSVKAGDLVFVPKDSPHSIRNTHPSENMVCVLAQSPLPCEHVPVDD
jgi:quercetin dioxygenase-like cupin family protein